jgi:hypothetical protein
VKISVTIAYHELGMSPEKIALATTRNAKRLFKLA